MPGKLAEIPTQIAAAGSTLMGSVFGDDADHEIEEIFCFCLTVRGLAQDAVRAHHGLRDLKGPRGCMQPKSLLAEFLFDLKEARPPPVGGDRAPCGHLPHCTQDVSDEPTSELRSAGWIAAMCFPPAVGPGRQRRPPRQAPQPQAHGCVRGVRAQRWPT